MLPTLTPPANLLRSRRLTAFSFLLVFIFASALSDGPSTEKVTAQTVEPKAALQKPASPPTAAIAQTEPPEPAASTLVDIQLSHSEIVVDGTGDIRVGKLSTIEANEAVPYSFRLTEGGKHNSRFTIREDDLYFKNRPEPLPRDLEIRVEASNGIQSIERLLHIRAQTGTPKIMALWEAPLDSDMDLVGYGEYLAYFANAGLQGWDLTVVGNSGIAFSQTPTGFEILATDNGYAGSAASISEISLRPSSPRSFNLDSLLLSLFPLTQSKVTISGYREGSAVSQNALPIGPERIAFHDNESAKESLDEVVLTFRPAIEAAELYSMVSSEP